MTFSYTGDLTNSLDYLRFRLGDKVDEYHEYEDEELQFFINKVSGSPTELDLDKIALKLLKQQLQELLRAPSRERSGQYEVYKSSAQSLKAAIGDLEDEIRKSSFVSPSFGGVNKSDYCSTKNNHSLIQPSFSQGMIYGDGPCKCGCGCYDKCCR